MRIFFFFLPQMPHEHLAEVPDNLNEVLQKDSGIPLRIAETSTKATREFSSTDGSFKGLQV